jgi:6-pyruvoyl-tetrahydropterin synthase
MYAQEALKIVDELMSESSHGYLNDLERAIVQGVCEGKKYEEIAKESGCTKGHVTDIASTLWQDLSAVLSEKVSKKNIKAIIERHRSSATVSDGFVQISSVNVCSDITINTQRDPKIEKIDRTPQKYLLDAPALLPFYGRTTELTQLQTYIENHSRLILIHAPSGTGKTALARQLIEQNPQYDTIIWQSLQCHRPLTEFLDRNITPNFSRILTPPLDLTQRFSDLIDQLTHQPSLIILDDLQEILWSQQLAGSYASEYRQYQQLFDRLITAPHQSTIILLSQEIPRHLQQLTAHTCTERSAAFQSLPLTGLGNAAQQIFQQHQLTDPDHWPQIITYYNSNPQALQIIATLISQFFGSSVAAFAQTQPLPIPDDYKQVLQQQLDRLTTKEKTVIRQIATGSVTITDLQKSLDLSPADIIDVLQSIDRRGLLQTNTTNAEVSFSVSIVLQEFLRN